jgi:Arc/MetJ-type ribon-helix-helix transcriptional regulator
MGFHWVAGYPKSRESKGFTAMTIEIRKPDLEQLVREEIRRGHFENIDDLLIEALQALREKTLSTAAVSSPRKNLAQFLLESPFAGSDLNLERQQDYGRPVGFSA